jgi:Fanconi anemia group M protein
VVAILVARARLEQFEMGKVVILAPTRPLAVQHSKTFEQLAGVPEDQVYAMTGETDPDKRSRLWRRALYVFATPQTVLNDLKAGRVDFFDVVLLVFDEAHRSVKDYAYTELARAYMGRASTPLILGLTASPGGSIQTLEEIKKNLFIRRIEARTEEDEDLKPYLEHTTVEGIEVELPKEYLSLLRRLTALFRERTSRLVEAGFLSADNPSKTVLLRTRGPIVSRLKASDGDDRELVAGSLVDQTQAILLMHGIELTGTEGVQVFLRYAKGLREKSDSATVELVNGARWLAIENGAQKLANVAYPKLESLVRVLADQFASKKGSRAIVFTQYRDTIDTVVERLKAEGVSAVRFVGQSDRAGGGGMSQKEQMEILERFRRGKFNVLVSSSIGEEGLHVPDVDLVVFYEAVPSAIRSIQRKGRTGRTRPGKVVVLLAKGTVDEQNYRSSLRREMSMRSMVSHESG